ncbi:MULTISPECIES: aspartyl protease family protein [unclassified Flavobacterium]|uniref:aspartyl protease family protein n=1 Tax=unclassified Flavobacterium TaxID=196869 RepID=UPI003260BE47
MKQVLLFFLLYLAFPVYSQNGFQFEGKSIKAVVSFQLINNLVFVPIKVNGVELNFLLDTGVAETILFSLEEKKEVRFLNTEKISLRGLGSQKSVEGLKSTNNLLSFGNMTNKNHLLYIVLDPEFNFSSHVGIPVNGIIGYHFFRNNLVEIDYLHKKIIVYKDNKKHQQKVSRNATVLPISLEKSKPYIITNVSLAEKQLPVKLLIDIGNSDAVWLFKNTNKYLQIPAKNFDDFLGRGFSGDIEGKRAKITRFELGFFCFDNPIAAFPDSVSTKNVSMVPDRMGSVGGEIMRRFKVVFDYNNQQLFLKKNRDYKTPFNYNKSGIEVEHNRLEWVQETVKMETVAEPATYGKSGGITVYRNDFKYKFQLKPIYQIAHVRKNSAAAKSGLQSGDVIVRINSTYPYNMTLQDLNAMFKAVNSKWITLEVQRNNMLLKFKFQLEDIL